MKIHVRRRHIEMGRRNSSCSCPVALAFKDVTGKPLGAGYEWLDAPGEAFKTPSIVRRFMVNFDAGKPVKPFAFVLK